MSKLHFICLIVLGVLILPASVSAHVLITDKNNQIGSVLHITPDDDPIAGQPSALYFDIESKNVSTDNYSFSLNVSGKLNGSDNITVRSQGGKNCC